jgi:peptidoglycan/LPS O-acetylase OafA/YrhL
VRQTAPSGGARSSGIDGLRGLAALSVLLFHLWLYARVAPPAGAATGAADWLFSSMRWGLLLFFVLSGFLLYRPWLAAGDGSGPPDLWRYVRSRAARVLPAYYLAVAGSVLLLWGSDAVPGVRLPSAESLPLFLVFAQNFSADSVLTLDPPLWTLAVEVSFYAVLPALGLAAMRLGRRHRIWLPISLIGAGLLWSSMVSATGSFLPLTKVLPAMLPFFGIGMLAATLARDRSIDARRARWLAGLAAVALAAQFGAQLLLPGTISGALHDLPAATCFAAIVSLAGSAHSPRALSWGPVTRIGTVSYGLYLWHVPVLWWLRARGLLPLDPILALPVVLAPSLLLATLSWRYVERPMIAWARRKRPSRDRATVRPIPVPGT